MRRLRLFFSGVALALSFGCATGKPLVPGYSSIGPAGISFRQSQNPAQASTQTYEKSTVTEPATKLTEDAQISTRPLKTTTTEKVSTTLGAAQKDTAREVGAKLASLKGVVWVGVLVFLFGAASAFYPPLKILVGSTTTSAVACAAGLALIVLPSLIVGNEILMIAIGVGAVGIYWFAHRHASVHTELKVLKKVL
jgi:hypothetical protein